MNRVSENLHILNSRDGFIHIKVNMLLEGQFFVKNIP